MVSNALSTRMISEELFKLHHEQSEKKHLNLKATINKNNNKRKVLIKKSPKSNTQGTQIFTGALNVKSQ